MRDLSVLRKKVAFFYLAFPLYFSDLPGGGEFYIFFGLSWTDTLRITVKEDTELLPAQNLGPYNACILFAALVRKISVFTPPPC